MRAWPHFVGVGGGAHSRSRVLNQMPHGGDSNAIPKPEHEWPPGHAPASSSGSSPVQAAQTQRGWLMSMMHEYELLRMAMGGGAHTKFYSRIFNQSIPKEQCSGLWRPESAPSSRCLFSSKSTIRRSIAPVLRQIAVELRLRLRHHKYCYCRQCAAGIGRVTGMSPSLLDWLGG